MDMPQANTEPIVAGAEGRLYAAEYTTKANRGIEAFSIPRFSSCAGAQRGLYTAISLGFERWLVA